MLCKFAEHLVLRACEVRIGEVLCWKQVATSHLVCWSQPLDTLPVHRSCSMHNTELCVSEDQSTRACLRYEERLATTPQAAAELCLAAGEAARSAELLLRAGALDRAAPLVAAADSTPLHAAFAQACEGVSTPAVEEVN